MSTSSNRRRYRSHKNRLARESAGEAGGEADAEQALEAPLDVGVEQAECLIDGIEIDVAEGKATIERWQKQGQTEKKLKDA